MSTTTSLRSVMAEPEYIRERQQLIDTYGEADVGGVERAALGDQAWAQFFHNSGWTQDRIAEVEGKGQQWVSRHLCLGRFLAFTPMGVKAKNLTERRFRSYWDATDKDEPNESERFRAVLLAMEADVSVQRSRAPKGLGPRIMEEFADGEWHRLETLREQLDCLGEDLVATLRGMTSRGTHKSVVESKPYGNSKMYRIMRQERMISSHELKIKLSPLVKALMEEGRKSTARMSPQTVAHLATKIQHLLDEWSEERGGRQPSIS